MISGEFFQKTKQRMKEKKIVYATNFKKTVMYCCRFRSFKTLEMIVLGGEQSETL
jgi:hypothetical protein